MMSTFGKSIFFKMSKCLSLVTIYLAFAVIAQSTNLLSSGSSVIKLKRKYGVINFVFLLLTIALITKNEYSSSKNLKSTSRYSSRISFETHKIFSPAIIDCQMGWNLLWNDIDWIRQLVSRTICCIIVCANQCCWFCQVILGSFLHLPTFLPLFV